MLNMQKSVYLTLVNTLVSVFFEQRVGFSLNFLTFEYLNVNKTKKLRCFHCYSIHYIYIAVP